MLHGKVALGLSLEPDARRTTKTRAIGHLEDYGETNDKRTPTIRNPWVRADLARDRSGCEFFVLPANRPTREADNREGHFGQDGLLGRRLADYLRNGRNVLWRARGDAPAVNHHNSYWSITEPGVVRRVRPGGEERYLQVTVSPDSRLAQDRFSDRRGMIRIWGTVCH